MNTPTLILLAGGAYLLLSRPQPTTAPPPSSAPPPANTSTQTGQRTDRQRVGAIGEAAQEIVGGIFNIIEEAV